MTGISFIQDLAIIMLVAGVAGWLFQRFGLSVIVGYLIAGMLVGPASGLLPLIEDVENIQTLSQVGLIFLMFSIGLNLSIRRLRRLGVSILVAAGVGALIIFNTTRLIAVLFGMTEVQGLFFAATLIVSSSVVISKILYDLGVAHRRSGQLALGVTALEDVLSILVLTFLISYVGVGETSLPVLETFGLFGAFVIFLVITGLLLVPRYLRLLTRKASMESQTLLVAALLFSLALLSHHVGYPMMLGAFLLGVIVAETPERGQVERSFLGLRHLFGTVFFVAVGMMIDIRSLFEIWPMILLISALTIAGRFLISAFSLMLAGNTTRDSVRAGLTLTPLGEFSFVIAQAGITAAVLPDEFFRLIVGVSVVTILVCPFLIRHSGKISRFFQSVEPKMVTNGIGVYHRFLTRVGTIGAGSRFWVISRRRFIQIGIGIAFITGLLLVGE
ncbi:MAG TPA: cation:proton antiporter, partial [Opitutales bacterium]|nr:cation:proton antiporter [Opitutales bacterium]